MDPNEAYALINSQFEPFPHQLESWKLIEEEGLGFCLLSGTGSGKTESVCIPSMFLEKRLVMVYPTRSLIEDQIGRLERYAKRLVSSKRFGDRAFLSKTIAFDTGDRQFGERIVWFEGKSSLDVVKGKLEFYQRWQPSSIELIGGKNERKQVNISGFMSEVLDLIEPLSGFTIEVRYGKRSSIRVAPEENVQLLKEISKKHLYGADIILTTLDMFLYRFFGYGEKKWNLLYPYRLYMGKQAKERLVICFDEAHLYDTVSFTNFMNLISTFIGSGIKVVVMSATLPDRLLDMLKTRYGLEVIKGVEISGKRESHVNLNENRNAAILKLVKNTSDERIIIVRNTVKSAFDTYLDIKKNIDGSIFFYHGRMFPWIRERNYNSLKQLDQNREPYILITTNAIEVGCDLDSTLLITDYCNPDQLLQRMGRCARKEETTGKVVILGTEFQIYDNFLLMPETYDYNTYNHLIMNECFKSEDIRTTITPSLRREELTDALFHFLYSYTYEFDLMRKELHDSGIIATRSWVPSFNVYWVKNQSILEDIEKYSDEESIEEIIDKLVAYNEIFNRSPLRIAIDYFLLGEKANPIDSRQLKIFTVNDKSSPKGYTHNRTINPYMTDLYLFFSDNKFPNNKPNLGLIRVPKFLTLARKGIIATVQAKKQYFANSKQDRQIRYLNIN